MNRVSLRTLVPNGEVYRPSRLVIGLWLAVALACGQQPFKKWNLIKVREVVPAGELVMRGVFDLKVQESRIFYMTGFEKQPPHAPSLRRWFSIQLTQEESDRITYWLKTIFPAEYVPDSVVRYGRKSRQNYAVTSYRFRLRDEDRWLYVSAITALTLNPDPKRGVVFIKGFVGNTEPIVSYDDVYSVARRYMNPAFLGARENLTELQGPTDTKEIQALAKKLDGAAIVTDKDLRALPQTFKLDNPTSRTYLRGGRTVLNDAGTLREMYGIGFRFFPLPKEPDLR